jgi:hypothetical protein
MGSPGRACCAAARRSKAFVMTAAGEMTGADQGALIAKALPRMVRISVRRPPFIANITAAGHVQLLELPRYRRPKAQMG